MRLTETLRTALPLARCVTTNAWNSPGRDAAKPTSRLSRDSASAPGALMRSSQNTK